MDAKDLRTESTQSERNNDGSKYSQSGGIVLHCDRNKSYHDIGSNSLSKVDIQTTRPCAVIGPDRVVLPPVTNEAYLKKASAEPWSSVDSTFHTRRPPEYPHKLTNYPTPTRNISPRQTFQENMQRIMVPPSYNSVKTCDDTQYTQISDRNILTKNIKINQPSEAKFCDVPYNVYSNSNEQNVRNSEMCLPSVNPSVTRTVPHGWPSGGVNVHSSRTYGAPDLYQYQEYSNCAGSRPVVPRPTRNISENSAYMYSEPFYHQDGNLRFKPYSTLKQRFPHQRYEYLGNYTNTFHPSPTFHHKYELQKSVPPHPYQPYPSMKYLDRAPETIVDGYQRTQQGSYVPFHNQVIHPNYSPVLGNCSQNKIHSYPSDGHVKPALNKLPYDSKAYIDYDNNRPKMYNSSDNYVVSEMGRMHPIKSQVVMPNYPTLNVHNIPLNTYYKKDNQHLKNYEYIPPHFRNMDPTLNIHNSIIRHGPIFSPTTLAISPTDSSASNDTSQMLGNSQEDCGYVSQSSTASIRSIDSGINRIPNDFLRKYYDNRFGPVMRSPMISKSELNSNKIYNSKEKKNLNVRQFLQMWNEGDEETEDNNSKEIVVQAGVVNDKFTKTHEVKIQPNQEQLYVLGLVNVPSEELGKYEHIQKVSKLPENIKGYNHIELLNQFEEAIQSSNMSNYKIPTSKDYQLPLKGTSPRQSTNLVLPRPLSPLDVEAKISQSIIHKEVGCNFEIKPCSPKMLNVEVATPVLNILAERAIEKVANPDILKPTSLNNMDDNIDCSRKDIRFNILNEPVKIPSCKMVNTHFSAHNSIDSIKSSYSLHDLESSSGLCLASLPRLDNDIELNFPEVNQQFINANKGDTTSLANTVRDLPTLEELDQPDNCHDKFINMHSLTPENDMKSPHVVDSEKQFSKLSKYRKAKLYSPNGNDNFNATRTDSVIIKNPENSKNYEENSFSPKCLEENTDNQNTAMNLTSQGNATDNTEKTPSIESHERQEGNILVDIAIDFSLNKTSCSDKSKLIESVNHNTKTNDSILDDHITRIPVFSDCDKNDIISPTRNIEIEKTNLCIGASSLQVITENEYFTPMQSEDLSLKNTNNNNDDMSLEACIKTTNDVRTTSPIPISTTELITPTADCLQILNGNLEKNSPSDKDYLKTQSVQSNMENHNKNQAVQVINNHCIAVKNITEPETDSPSYLYNNSKDDTISAKPIQTHDQVDYYTDPEPETGINFGIHSPTSQTMHSPCYNKLESPMQLTESNSDLASAITAIHNADDCHSENIIPQNEPSVNLPFVNCASLSDNGEKISLPHKIIKHSPDYDMPTETIMEKNNSNFNILPPDDIAIHCPYNDVTLDASDSNNSLPMINNIATCHPSDYQFSKSTKDVNFIEHNANNINTYIDVANNNTCLYKSDIDQKVDLLYVEHKICNDDSAQNIEKMSSKTVSLVEEKYGIVHIRKLRNFSFISKEMYSPWIQKLVMFSEGVINRQKINNTNDVSNCTVSNLKTEKEKGISSSFIHTVDSFTDSVLLTSEKKPIEKIKLSDPTNNYSRTKGRDMNQESAITDIDEKLCSKSTPCCKEEFHNSEDTAPNVKEIESILMTSTSPLVATDFVINHYEEPETSIIFEKTPIQQSCKLSNNDNSITDGVAYHCDAQHNITEVPEFCNTHNKCRNEMHKDLETSCKVNDNTLAYHDIELNCSRQLTADNNTKIKSNTEIYEQNSFAEDISVDSKEFNSNKNTPDPCGQSNSNYEITENEGYPFILCDEETPKPKSNNMLNKTESTTTKGNFSDEIPDTDNALACRDIQLRHSDIIEKENIKTECNTNTDNIFSISNENKLVSKELVTNKEIPELRNEQPSDNDEITEQEDVPFYYNKSKSSSEVAGTEKDKTDSACTDVMSELDQQNKVLDGNSNLKQYNILSRCNDSTIKLCEEERILKNENSEHMNYINCNTELREESNKGYTPNDKTVDQVDEPSNYGEGIIKRSDTESNYNVNTLDQWNKQFNSSDKIFEKSEKPSDGSDNGQTSSPIIDELPSKKIPTLLNVCSKKRQPLKRSLSDSALNAINNNEYLHQANEDDLQFLWPFKRKKYNNVDNNVLAQNLCSIIQSNRRNSVSSFYNEENVSFCILIDNSCIIAEEENDERDRICYTELAEGCLAEIQNDCASHEDNSEREVMTTTQLDMESEYSDPFLVQDEEGTKQTESWIEDVGCVETIISDDIAENVEISGPSSPKDDNLSDNDESGVFSNSEHTDKVKFIYGDKMCNDDAQFVDILYNTPQMDVNKTLIRRESLISAEYYDNDSLEKILSENNDKNLFSYLPEYTKPVFSPDKINVNVLQETKIVKLESKPWPRQTIALELIDEAINPVHVENAILNRTFDKNQNDLVHSNESSIDNVFTYSENERKENDTISGSPEVSSTTYEDKNSTTLLKITNYKDSRVSKVNNINQDKMGPSCKFTEDTDYLQSNVNYSSHRPLLTKAAQKYIPPLKESMRDLKVKLSLPPHSLIKLKELKKSKEEPKLYKQSISVPRSSKKPKPKFEDVLKSIDEIQFKMHKEKAKKSKKSIPKVVIKKNENGSHYASTSSRSDFNPDLTGRKWQPWVFIEKNHFIDKMAIKRKTKAIYNHRKKAYVLTEKFRKYKSVNNANFIITPPTSDCPPTGLKYTIRLKHSY